jgi:hypothetical protein
MKILFMMLMFKLVFVFLLQISSRISRKYPERITKNFYFSVKKCSTLVISFLLCVNIDTVSWSSE